MSESHGEEVLTSISPQISNVQSTPAIEASSSGDQDPIKETHRDEQKEAIKKPTVTGPARRPIGTAASSAASVAAAPARRTGTVLQRPPNRPPPGNTGAGAVAPRRTPSSSMATATTTTTASNTTNPSAATSKAPAPSSGVSRRSSAIGTPSSTVTRTPDKKSFGAGRAISPTVDRRMSSNITSSANAARRTAPAASTTTTAPTYKPRAPLPSAASSGSIGRPSTATSVREGTASPGPPPAAGRPTPAPARGLTGSSGLSRPSFSTLRSRVGRPGTPPAASNTTPGKELEALKAKVSGLEEKNKELLEQVSRAAEEPITNGEAKAATKELEAELDDLRAKIATLQQANESLKQKCTEFASAVETSAEMMKSANETVQAKHEQVIQSLREDFQAKENGLLAEIEVLKQSVEDLNNRHAEEVLKLTNQLREAAEAQSKAAKQTSDHEEAIRTQALAHDEAVEALNAALAAEKEAGSKTSSDTQDTINRLTDQIAALEKQLEEASEALKNVAIKDQDALEDHQREIDGLKNVIQVLQDEVEAVTSAKSKELDEKLAELRERHGVELSEAVNAGTAATQDVEAKIQALIKEHQQELEKSSGALDVKLEEVRSEAKLVEEELMLRLEAEKLHSAETREAAQESEAQRKELSIQLEALNNEWEGKIEQLQKLNDEKVNSLMAQLDAAQKEIIESSSKIGEAKQGDDALRSALEERQLEVEALKDSLKAVRAELLDEEKNSAKYKEDLEKSLEDLAAHSEANHKTTLDSQSAEHTARIEVMEADLTSGNEKYATLSKKYNELEHELEVTKSKAEAELESYEARLQEEKTTVVQLQASLAEAPDMSTLNTLTEQLDEEKASKNSELENLRKVLGEQISLQSTELAQEKAANQELLDKISSIETRVSALVTENERLQAAVEKSEAAEASYKSLETIYRVQEEDLINEIKTLKEKLGAVENGIGKDEVIDKLESEKREAEAAILRLEEEKNTSEATLKAELDALKGEKEASEATLKAELDALKGEKDASEAALKAELDNLKGEKDAALEDASLQLSSLKATTAEASATLEALTKEKSDLEAELKLLQEDHLGMEERIKAKESAIEQATKDSDELEISLKEKLGIVEALVREKEATLANIEKESAASLKVLEAEIAELRLYKKNQELSASQSPSTANIASLKMQLSQLEAANEDMNKENARMLSVIEKSLPLKTS